MADAFVYASSFGSSPAARITSFHFSAVVVSPVRPHAFINAVKDSLLGVMSAVLNARVACEQWMNGRGKKGGGESRRRVE